MINMVEKKTNKTFVTNDFSMSAYLFMRGKHLVKASKDGATFRFEFVDDGEIESLTMEYIHSESSKFDDAVRKIKKIIYGTKG